MGQYGPIALFNIGKWPGKVFFCPLKAENNIRMFYRNRHFPHAFLPIFMAICALLPYGQAHGDTVIWRAEQGKPGFSLDVPPEWEKDYEIKSNGILFQAFQGEALISLKSFSSTQNYSVKYILNKRAARLSARYSTIFMVQQKIMDGEVEGVIVEWRLNHKGREFTEKTLIYKKNANFLVLSCSAPTDFFLANKVIFENAMLSLQFMGEAPEIESGVNTYEIEYPPAIELSRPEPPKVEETQTPVTAEEQSPSEAEPQQEEPTFVPVTSDTSKKESSKVEPSILEDDSKRKKKSDTQDTSSGKKIWKGYSKGD